MDLGPEPAPASAGDVRPDALDCAAALALVRRFVAGDEDVEARPRLRAHLASCVACREQYRAEVVLVARLAHGGARTLSSVRRMEERAGRRLAGERRGRRVGLAHLLLPAMGLYALFAIAGPEEGGPVRCSSLGGRVQVAGAPLERGERARELARGALCVLEEEGRARLEWAGTAVVLEPDTALRLERQDPLRLCLFYGRLLVEGSVVVATPAGVVETESASAVVDLDAEELAVACTRGAARIVHVAGVEELAPGARAVRPLLRTASR